MKKIMLFVIFMFLPNISANAGIVLSHNLSFEASRRVSVLSQNIDKMGEFINRFSGAEDASAVKDLKRFQQVIGRQVKNLKKYIRGDVIEKEILMPMASVMEQVYVAEKRRLEAIDAKTDKEFQEIIEKKLAAQRQLWKEYEKLKEMIRRLKKDLNTGATIRCGVTVNKFKGPLLK